MHTQLIFFFDFAGYSAMAVGLSIMMGIFVPMNFNHPYLAPKSTKFLEKISHNFRELAN